MRPTLFVPITKVDLEKREVWGVAAEERTDKTRTEKFDYAASKPLFEEWIADFQKRTTDAGQGVSLGNIRYMHQPDAVGKAIAWEFDDAGKQIHLGTKVVDDACWEKVKEGVLTGFSIGGDYAKRWDDPDEPGVKRYAARPAEVSLVDNPCMYGATFQAVKADGSTELRKFQEVPMDVAAITARITALQGELGKHDGAVELRKGLYTVSSLADCLERLKWMVESVSYEFEKDEEKQPIVAQFKAATAQMAEAFLALAEAAVESLTAVPVDAAIPMALAAMGDLTKSDTAEAKKALRRLQKMHDLAVECGASCGTSDDPAAKAAGSTTTATAQPAGQEGDMEKAELEGLLAKQSADLTKVVGEHVTKAVGDAVAPLQKQLGDVTTKVDGIEKTVGTLDERLKVVEATPAATTGIVRSAPSKAVDSGGQPAPDFSKMHGEEKGIAMLKHKLASPGQPLLGERPVIASI